MNRLLLMLILMLALAFSAEAQEKLNVAPFFSDTYKSDPSVTCVEVTLESLLQQGITKYKSISISGNEGLANKLEQAVRKDGAVAESKEVIFKKGQLYFGFYFMGGSGSKRRYLFYLNKLPVGKDKTMLIFIEGDISEETAKSLIKK